MRETDAQSSLPRRAELVFELRPSGFRILVPKDCNAPLMALIIRDLNGQANLIYLRKCKKHTPIAYSRPPGREQPHQCVWFLLLLSVSALPVPSEQRTRLQRQHQPRELSVGKAASPALLPLAACEDVGSALVRRWLGSSQRLGPAPAATRLAWGLSSPLPVLIFDSLLSYSSSQSFLL
ncbi:hypothetical protein MG293_018545 [Ovis ammon polii]|uniref:Uncharacterized protein n=1 Tax=Ovis ammon polii TaxID=230172 RepID=A0AAD4Y3G5_OVIAM|nr:hypothetical protein MG293_018545 [Ovis ammon polii]